MERISNVRGATNPFILPVGFDPAVSKYSDSDISFFVYGIIKEAVKNGVDDTFVFDSTLMERLTASKATTVVEYNAYLKSFLKGRGVFGGKSMLEDKKFVAIVVNVHNSHWVLYILNRPYEGDRSDPLVFIVDSMYDPNKVVDTNEHVRMILLLDLFFKFHSAGGGGGNFNVERGFVFVKVPRQTDLTSCGRRVVSYIEFFMGLIDRNGYLQDIINETYLVPEFERRALRFC